MGHFSGALLALWLGRGRPAADLVLKDEGFEKGIRCFVPVLGEAGEGLDLESELLAGAMLQLRATR